MTIGSLYLEKFSIGGWMFIRYYRIIEIITDEYVYCFVKDPNCTTSYYVTIRKGYLDGCTEV